LVTLHQLGSLNEDELAMALYIVNCLEPKILTYELGRRLLCSIKHHKLCERVVKSEPFINELEQVALLIQTAHPIQVGLAAHPIQVVQVAFDFSSVIV